MDKKECCTFSLGSYFKKADDELHLTQEIFFAHTMHLTLSDHVHLFIALQGSPRGLERKEAHPLLNQPFDEAMVLLDKIAHQKKLTSNYLG